MDTARMQACLVALCADQMDANIPLHYRICLQLFCYIELLVHHSAACMILYGSISLALTNRLHVC